MKKIKRLCIPVVLGVLLIATVVGVASARPNARPQEQAWRVLTVPSQACIPQEDDYDWYHAHWGLACNAGCEFVCPVDFPAAGEQAVGAVNVKRVTMFAYENSGNSLVAYFWLTKTHPASNSFKGMAYGTTTDSPADPQTVMDTSIEYNPIYRVQGAHLQLRIQAPLMNVYGFFIHYTWM